MAQKSDGESVDVGTSDSLTGRVEDGCQSSDSGRDSPTDIRLRLDLAAGESDLDCHSGASGASDSDATTMDERRALIATSSATSVESMVSQERTYQPRSLSQHPFLSSSSSDLRPQRLTTQRLLSQHAFSDTDIPSLIEAEAVRPIVRSSRVRGRAEGAEMVLEDRVLSQRPMASTTTTTSSTGDSATSDAVVSQELPSDTDERLDFIEERRLSPGTILKAADYSATTRGVDSLSQYSLITSLSQHTLLQSSTMTGESVESALSQHPLSQSDETVNIREKFPVEGGALTQHALTSSEDKSQSETLSQHSFTHSQESRLIGEPKSLKEDTLIPRLDLGQSSDDEGTADTGLPYSEGEFTNRTSAGTTERLLRADQLSPESELSSLASDLSREALIKAQDEVDHETNVQEAIAQVSSEFVDGEIGYLRHSIVESEDSSSDDDKRPSVYHIVEPWSDQDAPAWSTSSSKEVTPREVKNAAANFKAALLEEAPTPKLQRLLLTTTSAPCASDGNTSIVFTKTPGPKILPLDHSTPYIDASDARGNRKVYDARQSPTRKNLTDPALRSRTPELVDDLDRTLTDDMSPVKSPVREIYFKTLPEVSPVKQAPEIADSSREGNLSKSLKFPVSKSPVEIRLSPVGERFSKVRMESRLSPVESYNDRLSESPYPKSVDTSPELTRLGIYSDQTAESHYQDDRTSSRRVQCRSDTEEEYQFRDLPCDDASASEEEPASIITQSSYKSLPGRRSSPISPRAADDKNQSTKSIDDSLGDTICREIEDFLSLHAQAKMLRTDTEGEYSEDSVARKVHQLIRRCELDRLSESRSTVVGTGSIVSDDLSERDVSESDDEREDRLAERVRTLLEKVVHSDDEMLDRQDPDDSLACRIRTLLERTPQLNDPSPRASPHSIHELIHSISITREDVDHGVRQELNDIQQSWDHRAHCERASPASQAESHISVATAQSKSSDDYNDKKKLAWDYGADIGEQNLPQFVGSVKLSEDEARALQDSGRRTRSVSPPRDFNDSYRVDLPTKSTSLLRVDRADISISSLRDDRFSLAERVFSLLQRESPQQQAYDILREAEEQERFLQKRSQSPQHQPTSGHLQYYGKHRSSDSLETIRSNVESHLSMGRSEGSTTTIRSGHPLESSSISHLAESRNAERRFTDLHRPVSSPSLFSTENRDDRYASVAETNSYRRPNPNAAKENRSDRYRAEELHFEKEGSRQRKADLLASPSKSFSDISRNSMFQFSPMADKPFGTLSNAQVFLSSQLQRATEKRFSRSPEKSTSEKDERIPDNLFRGKARPSIFQKFMDRDGKANETNDTNHDASRELSHIAKDIGADATRTDLVTLRQVLQHRDFTSSIETGTTSVDDTTMESTHTGSDDALAPYFPSFAYGTRVNTSAAHKTGVYGQTGNGEFLIHPRVGDESARSELSQSSNLSRKRAWVEEQMEDIAMVSDADSLKENIPTASFLEQRREPRRSLQILQDILEKESDAESTTNLDNLWERYQQKSKSLNPSSDNVKRLLRNMAEQDQEERKLSLASSGEHKPLENSPKSFEKSPKSLENSSKSGSWKIQSNSLKFEEINPNFKFANWKGLQENRDKQELIQSAPAALHNFDDQSPRSDKTVSSSNTDAELRLRMATLLEENDSLSSIPEDKILASERGEENVAVLSDVPSPSDPKLAKLHMKIRQQREKYMRDRRRENKRKDKIDKLERILEAKSLGQDITESSSASTTVSTSLATTSSTITDLMSSVTEDEPTVCSHRDDSQTSYCPCKFGLDFAPKEINSKPKVKSPPTPVYLEFDKPDTPMQAKRSKETKNQAVQTKEEREKKPRQLKEKSKKDNTAKSVDNRIERLVNEGTQTSPSLLKAIENRSRPEKKKKRIKKEHRKETTERIPSPEHRNKVKNSAVDNEDRIPSRSYSPDKLLVERLKKKPSPRGNVGGMCWFVPIKDRANNKETRHQHSAFTIEALSRRFDFENLHKENKKPLDCVCVESGVEFSLQKEQAGDNVDKISLQDAFRMFNQRFISHSRERQKRVRLLGEQCRMETALDKQRKALFSLRKKLCVNPNAHPLSDVWHKPEKRHFSKKEMKKMTEKVYRRLPEVLEKADLKKREAEYRTNRMRAEIYKRKQLNRVLLSTD